MRLRAVRAGVASFVVASLVAAPGGAGAQAPAISSSRTAVSTRIGEDFGWRTAIANPGRARLSGLVAHLNIVSWDPDVYVDPEDWSSQRTRYLAPLAAGESVEIPWTVKAVNSGRFSVYVVVLGAQRPVVSPVLGVRVAEHRTIDAGGALPLAVGVPALLGLVMIGVRLRRPR
jgi:hypothetical protein